MMNIKNIDPGKFNKKIVISKATQLEDESGFQVETLIPVLTTYAHVKTTRGFTLIKNASKFEEALTNFTIRYVPIPFERGMVITYNNKRYEIQYVNNIDEENVLYELQAKEVMQ